MNTRKVFGNIAYALIGVLVVAMIGLTIYQRREISNLSQSTEMEISVKNGPTDGALQATQEVHQQTAMDTEEDVNNLTYQLNAAEEELDMAQARLSDELERKAEVRKQQRELQKSITEDPVMRRQMQSIIVDQNAELFEKLNLAPEKLEKLKTLMTENAMVFSGLNADIFAASSSEEKASVQQHFDDIWEAKEAAVMTLLGNTDYETYEMYQDRLISKNYVTRFNESLGADEKLTKEQEEALVTIMYNGQEATFSELGYDPRVVIEFPSDLTDETIAERFKSEEKIHSQSVENARSILSDSQLKQFEDSLKSWREMEEMSLKMVRQQFGE